MKMHSSIEDEQFRVTASVPRDSEIYNGIFSLLDKALLSELSDFFISGLCLTDSISKLTSSMRLHSSSGIWSRRLGCVFRLAKSIRAGEFSASSMIVDAKFAVRLCWRSANAADAPPGVGFTGLSFEGIALPARPSESNLLTKAVRARRSSSSFCLSCIWT